MNKKGRSFDGAIGGKGYDRLATLYGMGANFYRRAVGDIDLSGDLTVLDLGCGTASLSFAASKKGSEGTRFLGIDISDDQLNFARKKAESIQGNFIFTNCSMDNIEQEDQSIDVVMTCMALHETPPEVRRGAIKEAARVLKKGSSFILVDWSKPRFGLQAIVWFPFLFLSDWKDNYHNVYRELCEDAGLELEEDCYLNSLARRQLFRKK